MEKNKIKLFREIIAIGILILFGIGIIKLIPTFVSLATEEGRNGFESKIENLGIKGVILIIALEVSKQ